MADQAHDAVDVAKACFESVESGQAAGQPPLQHPDFGGIPISRLRICLDPDDRCADVIGSSGAARPASGDPLGVEDRNEQTE